jgi:GMP synthase-like glutamine amidotransferase
VPRLLTIAHDHLSPGAAITDRFQQLGYELTELLVVPEERFHAPAVDVTFPDPSDFDALLVMGAPWSVYAEAVGSWVERELAMLRSADEAGVPVFGICFGGQLLAAALGGSVHQSPAPEIGLHAVHSEDPAFNGLWFQWHFDRFVPPPDATVVAYSAAAPQAFVVRQNLAVQFHPEVDAEGLARWLDAGGRAHLEAAGLDDSLLVTHVRANDPATRARAAGLVDRFLGAVATPPDTAPAGST